MNHALAETPTPTAYYYPSPTYATTASATPMPTPGPTVWVTPTFIATSTPTATPTPAVCTGTPPAGSGPSAGEPEDGDQEFDEPTPVATPTPTDCGSSSCSAAADPDPGEPTGDELSVDLYNGSRVVDSRCWLSLKDRYMEYTDQLIQRSMDAYGLTPARSVCYVKLTQFVPANTTHRFVVHRRQINGVWNLYGDENMFIYIACKRK